MSFIYEIVSGNIAENVTYQVTGTGSGIDYNGTTYGVGQFFTGIAGVTTYTKLTGTEIVTEASSFTGFAIGKYQDFFLGKFTDESTFTGLAIGFENAYYPETYTVSEAVQNGSNFINVESWIKVPYLIDEITSVVGQELYNGVSYERLLELESLHPEITLTKDADGGIEKMLINGIEIHFKTS